MPKTSKPSQKRSEIVLPGAHRVAAKARVYWYAWRGGPQLWAGKACDEVDSALEIAQAYIDQRRGQPALGTIARIVQAYRVSDDFRNLAATTRALYHPFLDKIEKRLGSLNAAEFGGRRGRDLIRAWRAEITPRSADQVKTIVGAVTSWARRNDLLPSDCRPTADMRALYRAPPQRAWTRAELDLAMSSLPAHLANVIALAVNTGLRRGDLTRVMWSAVDDAAGVLRIYTHKGLEHRRVAVIRLTPALRATLARIPKIALTILTNTRAQPWTVAALDTALDRGLSKIGITARLHGLRRLAATHLAAQGLSSRQIARQLGWSESEAEAMSAVYIDDAGVVAAQNATDA